MKATTVIVVLIWVAVAVLFMAYSGVDTGGDTTLSLVDANGDTTILNSGADTVRVGLIVQSEEEGIDSEEELCVEINSADSQMLTKLPGIGPVLAQRILQQRKLIGSFKTGEDLLQVNGIGPARLKRIKGHICF